jgi:uncharacterized protein YndB with AHSA1/START domain
MVSAEQRQIRIVRTIDAPIDRVWEVWTKPEHITNWWGPNGFSSTIHEMDFREGGEWKLTLHGPDGTNYPNRSVYKEIVPLKKIVFEHMHPHFMTTVHFQAIGDRTQIDWTMEFDTAELRDTVVETFKADRGQEENIQRLQKYLSNLMAEPVK